METMICCSWAEAGIHYDIKLFSGVIAFDMSTNNEHNVSSVQSRAGKGKDCLNSWVRWGLKTACLG